MPVILQTAGEQIADERHHIIVEALHVSLLDGDIIFINDDDGGNPVMFMKHLGKLTQSGA